MLLQKLTRWTIIAILIGIQLLFLSTIFNENSHSIATEVFVASVAILLLYSAIKAPIHISTFERDSYTVLLSVPFGALCCYYLNHQVGLGAVFAAGIVGTLASFIPDVCNQSTFAKKLPAAIYCGAFVGMSGQQVVNGYEFVLAAGFFAGVFLLVSKSLFNGIGGKLGTIAFLGVAFTYWVYYLSR